MNSLPTGHEHVSQRQALLGLLVVTAVVLVAYRETAVAMVSIWARSDTFAHAFLVPPITLWLVWRQRKALAQLEPRPCAWMLLPMGLIASAWLLGDLASVNSLSQLAMTALLVLAVPAVFGLRVTRVILFPLAFLFFAVPIGEFMLPKLMDWTADFTVLALRASGIPVFHEGNRIVIPSGAWMVVEACSGVRYLIASVMVGTLFAYLNYRTARRRWGFVAIAIAVPIVANWIRAYFIVLLGHLSGNTIAVGVDHLIYGWLFFGVVMGLMFTFGRLWHEPSAPSSPRSSAGEIAAPTPQRGAAVWSTVAGALVLVLLPHVLLHTIAGGSGGGAPQLARLASPAAGWQPSVQPFTTWKPVFQKPSAESNSFFSSNGADVGVYVAYYRQQNFEHKLVSSENQVLRSDDPLRLKLDHSDDSIDIGDHPLTVRSVLLGGSDVRGQPEKRLRAWQLYWVGDTLTSSDARAKWLGVLDRLRGRGDDAAAIVMYTTEERPADARDVLAAFVGANLQAIVAQLRATRDGTQASVAANNMPGKSRSLPE